MSVHNGEFLFIKSVKDGIPNRDPLNDSDARRIFPEEDGRISLSDVSIKRDIRDFVLDKYPEGGPDQRHFVFVQQIANEKGKLLGRKGLADLIAEQTDRKEDAKTDMKKVLTDHCFDVRTFGVVYSVKPKFHLTGPVQLGWGHSMHPVDTQYVQGTVVMPSSEGTDQRGEDQGKTQGTIWTTYTLPFAVFMMPGVINAKNATHTGMTQEDQELLLQALWQGTQHRQARGRGQQQPLLLVHVEYKDPFYRIGYLEDLVSLSPEPESWRQDERRPASLRDIEVDVTELMETILQQEEKIHRCRIWKHPSLTLRGVEEKYMQEIW
ncbi:CRISPR-associated protein, Csh2 family [Tindallia magadiensis]|uniref:CRISPR-associated protein, Csh2 family n=1 Tax=Tindallia magadiensis TaxID=69895 RepID=A0A1I3EP54_9FIRM|nr:type I CRISPR-associated protein Cas7 [Tindallia magadiensis]SFI00729.1 CRISPR-associated protein, Csh2 family [Tindallia magadiensis]